MQLFLLLPAATKSFKNKNKRESSECCHVTGWNSVNMTSPEHSFMDCCFTEKCTLVPIPKRETNFRIFFAV